MMKHTVPPTLCLAAGILVGLVHQNVAAGQAITIPDEPVCQTCRIKLEKRVSIGDLDGAGALPGQPWAVARTSNRILVIAGIDPTEILVFDWEGVFVETIGREGDGPGEYRSATALVVMPGDTVRVFDRSLGRQTVLSPAFEVIETLNIQMPATRAWRLDSKTMLVNGMGLSREGMPQPLHVLQLDGTMTDSFGAERLEQLMQVYGPHPVLFARHATPNADGGFWSVPLNEYRIELRAYDGSVIRVVERQPGWFPPWEMQPQVSPDQPPVPRVGGITTTREGNLIALILVPADDWREALGEGRPGPNGTTFYRWDPLRAYDTAIEYLDPRAGHLLAAHEIPFMLHGFLDSETVYAYMEDESGNPRIDLYRLVLEN